MSRKLILIYIISALMLSCGGNTVKKNDPKTDYLTRKTSAVFKNAELIFGDEWKIVFRKLDDYQYIIFSNSVDELNTFSYRFICPDANNVYTVCPDYMDIRFEIDYIETTMPDPVTGESVSINRIVSITRTPGDRYSAAGITSDVEADDFIINLKNMVRSNNAEEISGIISYPITVYANNRKIKITSPQMFVNLYSQVFNSRIVSALANQSLGDIKADSNGLIIGNGEIRISFKKGRYLITEIDNR